MKQRIGTEQIVQREAWVKSDKVVVYFTDGKCEEMSRFFYNQLIREVKR